MLLIFTIGGNGNSLSFTDECLVLAINHNGGVNVTTTLKSGFTETYYFQNVTLMECGGNTKCPVITVDKSNQVNISEAVAIIMIERGFLLLRFEYNNTGSLELTDNYTLTLECTPLVLIPSEEFAPYLIICITEVHRLFLNSTDLSQSTETFLFSST